MNFRTKSSHQVKIASLVSLSVVSAFVSAQDDKMTPIAIPDQPSAIALNTGRLLGAKNEEAWHMQYGSKFARNVVEATLTPFLPSKDKATGAAVIVAPGGGFRTLSMENEGWNVAKALADRGVAAFVLKYRLNQTPAEMAGFEESMRQMFSGAARRAPAVGASSTSASSSGGSIAPQDPAAAIRPMIEDATAAFKLIRDRSSEWNIDPKKVGMIGFSAGAMLTLSTTLYGKDVNPAFIGNVYGPLNEVKVPENAPPLFVALAADDPFFANAGFGLISSWKMAKRPVEFHLYEQGGHGFGMYPKTTTSTGWFGSFAAWLKMYGYAN